MPVRSWPAISRRSSVGVTTARGCRQGFRSVRSIATASASEDVEIICKIENMEGAAFFYACLQCGVPFLELRAVSNRVGDPFPEWDVRGAVTALADSLCELLHFLNTERT